MTGTVSASTLEGGEINLLNGSGQTAGIIELTGASSYGGQKVVLRSGAIELNSQAGDVYIRSGSYGNYLQLSNGVFVGVGDLAPPQQRRPVLRHQRPTVVGHLCLRLGHHHLGPEPQARHPL